MTLSRDGLLLIASALAFIRWHLSHLLYRMIKPELARRVVVGLMRQL